MKNIVRFLVKIVSCWVLIGIGARHLGVVIREGQALSAGPIFVLAVGLIAFGVFLWLEWKRLAKTR